MAFGFGFNKVKVLASAEKYVQQGKLNNAIIEYEKIVEKDPKDLTVQNTIGDLYARLGQTDKAGEYFKRIGDTYAGDGFTVKAIAMYKKLTKLNPSNVPVVQRLAELYTQQGLYNDARQQYLQLADGCIKGKDLPGAAKIFQKMLEIDPDNVSLQSKLADLYVKMGKKDDARDIFLRAATSLFERGSTEQADQALEHLMGVDPNNADALLMRGKIAMDAGDGAAAVTYLEKVPNIDSKPDGLQVLLRAYILTNSLPETEGVARKLLSVHNDLSGIRQYADLLLSSGNAEGALQFYDEFADRLLVGDTGELIFSLQGLTGQLKDDPASLLKLRNVFEKAGATGNIPEVNELLAHAYVQAGELAKARDLYKELADLEPSNPLHLQNYRQVMAKLGEDATARQLSAIEAKQAFFVEEIEAPPIEQEYPAMLREEIDTVLSEAELFESYNKAAQALPSLKAVLAKAPKDARINQRLLSIYQKLERYGEAALCCDTLKSAYESAGVTKQAKQYADMARKFREQSGTPEPVAEMTVDVADTALAEMPVESVQEFTTEAFDLAAAESERPAVPAEIAGEAHEVDLSAEWEAAIEPPAETTAPERPSVPEFGVTSPSEFEVAPAETHLSVVADLLEEIRFYLSQAMWDEARSAISRCEQADANAPGLTELKQQLEKASVSAAGTAKEEVNDVTVEVEPEAASATEAEESTVSEFDFETASAEPGGAAFEVVAPEPVAEFQVAADAPAEEIAVSEPEPVAPKAEQVEVTAQAPTEEAIPAEEVKAEKAAPELEVADLPESAPVAKVPAVEAEPVVEPPVMAAKSADVLSDMVLDLESALGEDFGTPPQKPVPQKVEAPLAAAAMAATPAMVQPSPMTAVATAQVPVSAVSEPIPSAEPAVVASAEPTISKAEASSVLSDLFEEFKEEVGEPAEDAEDPETHYNLGVAFKEMGLLDEAIGELQKVCKAIDSGAEFSQVMQAYTWLANCFVEKGVPEAGIKWYEKALKIPSSEDSRTALHYDLAAAYEAAGDKPAALKHFTEVYGSNIDYRDVAERIKSLKS